MGTQQSQIVRGIYDAFGRGDLDAALSAFAEDVEWDVPGPAPYTGVRHGREQVRRFFADLAEVQWTEEFDVDQIVAEGDTVVVMGRERATALKTDATFEQRWAHGYTLRNGKVAAVRCYEDTHAQASAFGETNREREAITGPLGVTHPAYSGRSGGSEF